MKDMMVEVTRCMLKEELMSDKPRKWYLVSLIGEKYEGGYFIRAHGTTDALFIFHNMGWYPPKCGAETMVNEIPHETMVKVRPDQRWCKLTAEELDLIGR